MIKPINKNIIIEPQEEKSPFQSSQQSYEERGKVIAIASDCTSVLPLCIGQTSKGEQLYTDSLFEVGDFVFFDSWCAAKYKDKDGKEFWVVPYDKIRAVEYDTQIPK